MASEPNTTKKSPDTDAAKDAPPKRSLSPSYPGLGLADCLRIVKEMYDAERRNLLSREQAAKALGYKSLSGASRVALSAIKKFGLIAEEGDRVRVSDDAFKYFMLVGDPEQQRVLAHEFAVRPEIFKDIFRRYQHGLPADQTLKAYLTIEKDFEEAGAENAIKALRDTVPFVRSGPDGYILDQPMDVTSPAPPASSQGPARPSVRDDIKPSLDAAPPPTRNAAPSAPWSTSLHLPCGTVVIGAAAPLTAEDYEDMISLLKSTLEVHRKRSGTPSAGHERSD